MCDSFDDINQMSHMLERVQCFNQDNYYTECFENNEMMNKVYVTFAKMSTDENKFLYVYDMLKKFNKLPTTCEQTNLKNNKKAQQIRIEANKLFNNKEYASALCKYNKSVMTAIIDSQEYAFALANRSAALYYLEEYEACISDIHYSMAAKYPNELIYKLYEREIKCLMKLGKVTQAELKFSEFMSYLSQALLSIKKKRKIQIYLTLLINDPNKKIKTNNYDKKNIIKLLGGSNKNIPALSKHVKMKYSESMGRCLIASTDIKPGDILAIEKPYAGTLLNESLEHNCRNCFKRCLGGLPCHNCTSVIYCNDACRRNSYDNGHKYECAMFIEFSNWVGIQHLEQLALNIFLMNVCKVGLENYITSILALKADTTDPIMRGFNTDGKYLSDQFCAVYTLEGNENKRKVNDLFIRHCYASIMISFLALVGLKIPDNQLGIVGESLVHIMCVVSSNAHGISQYTVGKSWSLTERYLEVASLLMPVLSLLNHHCDPNVVRYNYNGTVVLRAIQPISKNSQLFDNYGQMYATHSKYYRQLTLNTQYLFHCECQPCKEDWPTYDVLSLCKDSKSIMLTDNCLNEFEDQSDELSTIISSLTENKCSDGLQYIEFLHTYLLFLHNNIKKPWKEFCNCQETIKEIFKQHTDKFIIEDN